MMYANGTSVKVVAIIRTLEQQERLRSENTPRRTMITHIIHSYRILESNKTRKFCQRLH